MTEHRLYANSAQDICCTCFAVWDIDLTKPEEVVAHLVDVDRLRLAIYTVSQTHDWANTVDTEDRTQEIVDTYRQLGKVTV